MTFTKESKGVGNQPSEQQSVSDAEGQVLPAGHPHLLELSKVDPALHAKMALVNSALDRLGWTRYHWKLFFLTGAGYAVDALALLLQSIITESAANEFNPSYRRGLLIAIYCGMLVGALFWGLFADVVGRKWAFNISLFIASISGIAAGAAPNWESLGFFICMLGFGGGGNIMLDSAVLLEYLPSKKQWVLTWLAAWWGVGQTVAGLVAWPLLSTRSLNCIPAEEICTRQNNQGWRYEMYACSGLIFILSVLRVTVFHLVETPKYMVCSDQDEALVSHLRMISDKYGKNSFDLTVEQLQACGKVSSSHATSRMSLKELKMHVTGLFVTRRLAVSTLMLWFSWALIGLAYPLYFVFLPAYLSSRGAQFGEPSASETWRNYAIVNVAGILGPVAGGHMADTQLLGRKYTMTIGALLSMAFFFGYTQIQSQAANIGVNCAIAFANNIYYGTLYAYTPEVLPSAHRTTGGGIGVALNRTMGIVCAVIATVSDTSSSVPMFLAAALYLALGLVSALFPFEPAGQASS